MIATRAKRVRAVLTGLLVAVAVSGCSKKEDRVLFDGLYFKAKTSSTRDNRAEFQAAVFEAAEALEAAREAGRYEGTKYCIANYGTSRIDWAVGPDDPDDALALTDGTLTFQGRCAP